MESSALLNNVNGETKEHLEAAIVPVAQIQLYRDVITKPLSRNAGKPGPVLGAIRRKIGNAARKCNTKSFLSLLPVLTWLPRYPWRTDLIPDILAGLTVGIMAIPQGMAYARLGSMPPVYGLYTNIIPTFVYFFFGTAKHAAIGPATVLCLITASIRYKYIPCEDCWMEKRNVSDGNETIVLDMVDDVISSMHPIDIGSALGFLVGIFLLLMGLFRLSFIADYLPDYLVGGFTVAAAVQVFTGQLPSIFGVKLPTRQGPGKVLRNFFDLFSLIHHTNLATLLTFSICFVFLMCSKKLISPWLQRKFKAPFPGEFFVMALGTLISYYAQFQTRYGVSTVRDVPAGFPMPTMPKFSIMGDLLIDAFILAVITYSHCISLAKVFAKRNGYPVQTAQEFYAYGFMNMVGSFFQCFNAGQSVARSLVYEMAGAKSQLCGLFGTIVVIFTVIFIAPFLASLPHAVLASVIVAACVEMFHNLVQLPSLFRKSRYDFSIFMMTLVSVILLGVTYGLAVSVTFALITVIVRSQKAMVDAVDDDARLLYTSNIEYKNGDMIDEAFWDKVKVWRFTSSVFYANAERVKNGLLEKTMALEDEASTNSFSQDDSSSSMKNNGTVLNTFDKFEIGKPEVVIVEMTAVAFTDLMGINALKDVANQLKKQGRLLFVCGCTDSVLNTMERSGFVEDSSAYLFPTLMDGIYYARFYLQTGITPDNKNSGELRELTLD